MPETISVQELQERLRTRNKKGTTWAQMGREYELNPTILWRIANEGYEPKRADMRKKLSLHQIIIKELPRDPKGRFTKDE